MTGTCNVLGLDVFYSIDFKSPLMVKNSDNTVIYLIATIECPLCAVEAQEYNPIAEFLS